MSQVRSVAPCKRICTVHASNPSPRAARQQDAKDTPPHDLQYPHRCDVHGQQQQYAKEEEEDAVVTMLQLKVRALEKYKTNYELLCSQLGELNDQIGLQLEQHERDVATLNGTIESLQDCNQELARALAESNALLENQKQIVRQDRAYSERVHSQLSTAADLLKATEKRIESQETALMREVDALQTQLAAAQQGNEDLRRANSEFEQEMSASTQTLAAKCKEEVQKHAKLKWKHKQQVAQLRSEIDTVTSELETQRALNRNVKKQLAHQVSENETLKKQWSHVKDDVEHLSAIIGRQQETAQHHEHTRLRHRKQLKQLEMASCRAAKQTESLQCELMAAREDLVRKNAIIEALHCEIRTMKTQLEQQKRELDHSHTSTETLQHQVCCLQERQRIEKRHFEEQERAKLRSYRKELHQMRQLLAVNHQKTSESSKDVQALKNELFSVQEMLHGYRSRRDRWKDALLLGPEEQQRDEEEGGAQWTTRETTRAKAEGSVLKYAIMEQVHAA